MREEHPLRVVRGAGLRPDRVGEPGRVDDQHHRPAEAQPVRGEVHLVGAGQVDEPLGAWRQRPVAQGGAPRRRLDQVQEDVGGHGAILLHRPGRMAR